MPQPRGFSDVVQRSYQLWLTTKDRFSPTERQRLFGLTILIGGVCGLVAVAFHETIRGIESLTIDRAFAVDSDDWVIWVVLVPAAGALACGALLLLIPGARGSGIPQVKAAYASKHLGLRVRDAVGKFAIGSLQIGTGSSLGREGPTVQICSGVAKAMGKVVGVSPQNLKLLLPVGSAAGIAAAFNAPIAAVTFTIEEIVGKLDQTLLSGVIVAAALAAAVERSLLGDNPVFRIPQGYGLAHPSSLLIYAALGIAAAVVSVAFSESLLFLRDRFRRPGPIPVWTRPAIGGLITGGIAAAVMTTLGVTGITGGGYHTLVDALSGQFPVEVLLVLGAAKLVATVFSYSTGGAGGIFAPSLFVGAMLGGAFGALDVEIFGHGDSEVGAFALVGMGAVFAGTIRAPITSVLIIIEMTGGYGLTLPLMISNMTAYGLARRLRPMQVYDAFLVQDGVHLEQRKPADPVLDLPLSRVALEPEPQTFEAADPAAQIIQRIAGRQEVFPVLAPSRLVIGLITLEDLAELATEPDAGGLIRAADIMRPPVVLRVEDGVTHALDLMSSHGLRQLPVVDGEQLIGVVDEASIARALVRLRAFPLGDPSSSGTMTLH